MKIAIASYLINSLPWFIEDVLKTNNNIIIDLFKKSTTLIWRSFWNSLYDTKTL